MILLLDGLVPLAIFPVLVVVMVDWVLSPVDERLPFTVFDGPAAIVVC